MNKFVNKMISGMVLCTMLTYTMPILAYTNEETIYSKLNSSGEAYKNIVTTLTDEESIQEEIDKELPVDCKVTYTLDGRVMDAKEIAGKSGRVTITLEYTNKLENKVKVSDRTETLYTPFLVVSGAIIENENNKNIEISNGKIINNGNKTIVIGFALPGMDENLKLSNDLEIPNSIEISMDAVNFEMGSIMSFATPKIFEEGSFDDVYDKLDEVYSQITELENASGEIESGTITLRDGMATLNSGAQDLNNGAKQLKSGADSLKDGSSKISAGANSLNENYAKIDGGIKGIQAQVPTLTGSVTALGTGIGQILTGPDGASGLVGLNTALSAVVSNPTVTVTGDTETSTAINQVSTDLSSIDLNTQKSNIDAQIATLTEISATDPTVASEIAGVITNLESISNNINSASASVATAQTDLGVANTAAGAISTNINFNNTALGTILAGYQTVTTKLNTDVLGGIKALGTGANSLVDGINTLSTGSDQVKVGINELAKGAGELDAGVAKLVEGSNSLTSGSEKLANGSNSLASGTNTLADGVQRFNAEGIQKISNLVNGDVRRTENRLKAMEELSNQYQNFASDEEREEIKFISILDAIKISSKDESNEEIIETPKLETDKKQED